MAAPEERVPTPAELQAFSLGKLDSDRSSEIEAHLAEHPECLEVVAAAPDDEMVQHLRGAGDLPEMQARPRLLQLAIEAVLPVIGGCAGALAGGAEGGLVGVAAGQVIEKGINFFGQRIVDRWRGWLRNQPAGLQAAALTDLAELAPEVARSEVLAVLAEQAPQASEADRQAVSDYLSAIPRSVRRSLLTGRERGGRQLPPTMSADDSRSLLQLLPTDLPPYSAPTALPRTDYQLEELIGSGGFGAVYRASSPSLQYLPLAIKFCRDRSLLPALRQERANLERLMRAGGKTWSPRLVRLYGYNLEHPTPYLVYEFVAGGDLVHWLAGHQARLGRGPTPSEVLELMTQVVESLAFAHERGLVHRDIKPANVLMTGDGTIKLADFGIGGLVARHAVQVSRIGTTASNRLSAAEQVSLFRGAGTPLYMSLEQKQGADPDPRHDIYSLGVTWYQLLVGDVTREMTHGWSRELEKKLAVPAGHVQLIERCVGWIEERPRDASVLLPLLKTLQTPEETQIGTAAEEPRVSGSVPAATAIPQLPRSVETQSGEPPAPSTAERFRQIRFVNGLRQLVERHDRVALDVGELGGVILSIVLGLILAVACGSMLGAITSNLAAPTNKADAEVSEWATKLGILVGFLSGFGLLGPLSWLLIRLRRKLRIRAEEGLSTKIDQMLTMLPQECQTWGGRPALADRTIVKEILRELEPPKR